MIKKIDYLSNFALLDKPSLEQAPNGLGINSGTYVKMKNFKN